MATTKPPTRERLLDVAASLMWERSFHAAGVDEICARADARKGSFYHFFPSKTDLAVEAVRRSWDAARGEVMDPIFDSDRSGLDKLRDLVAALDRYQRAVREEIGGGYLGCPFGGLGGEMARQEEAIRATVQQIFEDHCAYFARALEQAVAEGDLPPGDTAARARTVFAILQGGFLLAKVADDPDLFRSMLPAVEAAARLG